MSCEYSTSNVSAGMVGSYPALLGLEPALHSTHDPAQVLMLDVC
jgi:hypothetical protein